MPEHPLVSLQLLKALAQNKTPIAFEDLAKIIKVLDQNPLKKTDPINEKRKESMILDHLIALHDQGLVLLDPETDESSTTAAGLEKFNSLKLPEYVHKK